MDLRLLNQSAMSTEIVMLVKYCREQVYLGKTKVIHINTEKNIADIMTTNISNTELYNKRRDKLLETV
jgi:hypothetical protein